MTRRAFVKGIIAGTCGTALHGIVPARGALPQSSVVIARAPGIAGKKGAAYREACRKLIDAAIASVTGKRRIRDAWESLLPLSGTVGIKVTNERTRTDYDLVMGMAESMIDAGQKPERIIVFERSDFDLTDGKYPLNMGGAGVQCYGIAREEWHGRTNESDQFGSILYEVSGAPIRISRIVAEVCDAIINVPVIKRMYLVGISCALKNHFGSIDNPVGLHGDGLQRNIARLAALDVLRSKTKLTICEAVRHFGDHHVGMDGIIMSPDQVAVDYFAAGILENHLGRTISPPPRFIRQAAELGLGTDDPRNMHIQKIDV